MGSRILNRKIAANHILELEKLIEELPAAVWQANPKTYAFEYVSKGAESLLGFLVEDWVSDSRFWMKHLHPEDRRWAVSFCQSAVEARQSHEFEYRMIDAQGRIVWIRDFVKVVVLEDGSPKMIGLMIDVTKRHETERVRLSGEEQIRSERTAEAIGELTASVAHDFNNALTVISMHLDLLRNRAETDSESVDSLTSIESALRQASDLTRSLMAIGLDSPTQMANVDLRAAVSKAFRVVRRVLPAEIEVALQNPSHPSVWIRADALRIQQLILNLALDARTNMVGGGELIIAVERMGDDSSANGESGTNSFESRCRSQSPIARLAIKQRYTNKPTIPNKSDDLDRSLVSNAKGSGSAALAEHYPTVLDIVENHNALFSFDSNTEGTTIQIDFPCVSVGGRGEGDPIAEPDDRTRIFVAEKDRQVRDIVAATLRDSGYHVIPISTRADLESQLEGSQFGMVLVVLGAKFLDCPAVEFLELYQKNGGKAAAIILVEPDEDEDIRAAMDASGAGNAMALLCKPFSTTSLVARVQSVLSEGGVE